MSLKSVHLLFISLAIMLTFGFSAWNLLVYFSTRESLHLLMGAASVAIGSFLLQYERWIAKKLSRWN